MKGAGVDARLSADTGAGDAGRLADDLADGLAFKDRAAGQHFVEHADEGPQLARAVSRPWLERSEDGAPWPSTGRAIKFSYCLSGTARSAGITSRANSATDR